MIQGFVFLQGAPAAPGTDISFFIMMGLVMVVMYFFIFRPQSKKAKDQKSFITEVKKGDKIVTIGGIHGKVAKVNDDTLLIEVDGNMKLKIEKSVVSMEFTKAANSRTNTEKENSSSAN